MLKEFKKITLKRVGYSLFGLVLIAMAVAAWSTIEKGLDPIGAAAFALSDKLFANADGSINHATRGYGTTMFMLVVILSQVILVSVRKQKHDWWAITMQTIYAFVAGSFINLFIEWFSADGTLDYTGIKNLFVSNEVLNHIWLGTQYTVWLIILLFGAVHVLKAKLLMSAPEKLMVVLNELFGFNISKARLLLDVGLVLYVLLLTTLFKTDILEYFNYGTFIALVLTGPLFGIFYKKIRWVKE